MALAYLMHVTPSSEHPLYIDGSLLIALVKEDTLCSLSAAAPESDGGQVETHMSLDSAKEKDE